MDNCELYRELLSARQDGELSPEEISRLEEHLAVCPDCRSYAALLAELSGTVGTMAQEPPEALARSVMEQIKRPRRWTSGRITAIAAAAAVVLIAAYAAPVILSGGRTADSAASEAARSNGAAGSSWTEDSVTTDSDEESAVADMDEALPADAADNVNTTAPVRNDAGDTEPQEEPPMTPEPFNSRDDLDGIQEDLLPAEGLMTATVPDAAASNRPKPTEDDVFWAAAAAEAETDEGLRDYEVWTGPVGERYYRVPMEDFDALAERYGWTILGDDSLFRGFTLVPESAYAVVLVR